ncbi:MAG TPA: FAD-binding oxidoreductase, partial [Proteobacteria bacterium]|nr:FAD-binding oxidoreductase [Pseudomonadota bacterium]
HLERYLNAHGHTLGHFPASIYCCTIGGNLATRSAGQMSSKYGKIEDMVVGLEVVTPKGQVIRVRPAPRRATGPDIGQLFIGSEGTLGIITEAALRIWKLPEERVFGAFKFPDVESGVVAMRRIMQSDIRPAVMRFYDELDTALSGSGSEEGGLLDILPLREAASVVKSLVPGFVRTAQRALLSKANLLNLVERFIRDGCLMILIFEGNPELAKLEFEEAKAICTESGAEYLGPAPAQRWFKNRYSVSYKQSKVFHMGAFPDTIELATSWDRVLQLYRHVRSAIAKHALVLAHFSHAYVDGCSIYFTFVAAGMRLEDRLNVHRKVWQAAMEACLKVGATISHHHGVGLVRSEWMEQELPSSFRILEIIKSDLDPQGIMNPHKLGFGRSRGEA